MSTFWGVVRSLPHKETFAAKQLEAGGFETLLPRVRNGHAGPVPLFVGYLFVHIVDRWRAIDSTIGVMKLVRFGDAPARMPEAEIAALKARMDGDGLVRLPPPPGARRSAFVKGDRVRIIGGAFDRLAGVHTGMSASEREIILIKMLAAQRRIAVPAHLVRSA